MNIPEDMKTYLPGGGFETSINDLLLLLEDSKHRLVRGAKDAIVRHQPWRLRHPGSFHIDWRETEFDCFLAGIDNAGEHCEAWAWHNVKALLFDAGCDEAEIRRCAVNDAGAGRYCFEAWLDDICAEINMPGIPLDTIRFHEYEQRRRPKRISFYASHVFVNLHPREWPEAVLMLTEALGIGEQQE